MVGLTTVAPKCAGAGSEAARRGATRKTAACEGGSLGGWTRVDGEHWHAFLNSCRVTSLFLSDIRADNGGECWRGRVVPRRARLGASTFTSVGAGGGMSLLARACRAAGGALLRATAAGRHSCSKAQHGPLRVYGRPACAGAARMGVAGSCRRGSAEQDSTGGTPAPGCYGHLFLPSSWGAALSVGCD